MNNKEIAQKTVDRMLDIINNTGRLPWVQPWTNGSRATVQILDGYTDITIPARHWSRAGKAYKGINIWLLNLSGKRGEWVTFKQCQNDGGKVKKGAKGQTILYWQMLRKEDPNDIDPDTGRPKVKTIPLLKYYTVFNVEADCEGLKTKHHPEPEVIRIPQYHSEPVEGLDEADYNTAAEAIIAGYIDRCQTLQLDCKGNSNEAYYAPYLDKIVVPNITQYQQPAEYYSTLFHELGHSTGHSSRLNRFTGSAACAAFGSESYSREELVAEITAATILNELGLESGNTLRNSAAYVKSWASHIKEDPMMFVTAAGKAEKAVDLILGTAAQPGEVIA